MIRLPYNIFKENRNYTFYKDFDLEANCEVIYKVPNNPHVNAGEIQRLRNELSISDHIQSSRVAKGVRLDRLGNKEVLVRSFVNGIDLQDKIAEGNLDFATIIKLSFHIAEALKDLHDAGFFHKDIKPSNIIINEKTGLATLIDLGLSDKIGGHSNIVPMAELDGTLDYISPEQTGRVNRHVDYRTDFYSLGVTFYHLASGQLPYTGEESLSLIHKHIAADIPSLHVNFTSVQVLFSRIVAKLMSKNPDDRYQSASGLLFDLLKSDEIFESNSSIIDQKTYKLGQFDVSNQLRIPDRLYGRDKEIRQLERAFDGLNYSKSLILINGRSGTGKTRLALKLKEIAHSKGCHFIEGKFDHLQKNIPYSALIYGLQSHIDNILVQEDESVAFWSSRFRKALGRSGKVIVDIIPNLELLTGPMEEVPVMSSTESQNRFNNAFVKFIISLGTVDHPTVFLIDDLQWADLGSITILQNLLQEASNKEILIVGTYRDNEVHEAHPLAVMLRSLKDSGLGSEEIILDDLTLPDVTELCHDCFGAEEEVKELAALIYQKTNGNAFFTLQLLRGLHENSAIFIDPNSRKWKWNTDKIILEESSNNVVEYMTAKLTKLSNEASTVLKYASCIGNNFDRQILEKVISISNELSDRGLDEAIINGLVIRNLTSKEKGLYQFVHDRIQQAAYQNLAEDERSDIHLSIGRTLQSIALKEGKSDLQFDVVDQLNNGLKSISSSKEKDLLVDLNIAAAKMARNAAAYDIGLKYAKTGYSLLPPNHWEIAYNISLTLFNEIAENAFLKTDFEEAHQHIDEILKHAKTVLDTDVAYKLRVLVYHAQNQLIDSIYAGLAYLEQLGVFLPKNPGKRTIILSFLKTRWTLRNETMQSLLDKPLMTDPVKLAAIQMLTYLNGPTYIGLPNLNPILIFEQVRLSVKYGNTSASSSGYGGYGLVLCGVTGEMRHGALYAQLAKDIVEKYDAREEFAKAHLISNVFVRHWSMPLPESQSTTSEIYLRGVEAGDYVFAAYGAEVYCFMHLFAGTPLNQFYEEVEVYDHAVLNVINQKNTAVAVSSIRQTISHLMDPTYNCGKIKGSYFDYDESFDYQIKTNDLNGIFKVGVYQMMMYYCFEQYDQSAVVAQIAKNYKDAGIALFHIGAYYFYNALIILARLSKMNRSQKISARLEVAICLQKIKWYKKFAPFSYDSKYLLILAEVNRYKGNKQKARDFYEQSIHQSGANGLTQECALACERYASYLDELGLVESLIYYLKKAISNYYSYGALSKVTFLQKKYSNYHLLPSNQSGGDSITRSTTLTAANLNISTIYKASQLISGVIVLDDLLLRMMSLLLENAGANKGWFLIREENDWFIRAYSDISNPESTSTEMIDVSKMARVECPLSLKIVQYADRTAKAVVLGDASNVGKFSQDEMIKQLKSKSVFCSPVVNQGKILGMIYLVNDHIVNAFTEDSVDLLNLLSSQLSVSLQNALLYDSLESQVKQRTSDLIKERDLSESLLKNILPAKVAEELKNAGAVEARYFPKASVLFTDFKDFTLRTKEVKPKKLVEELDFIFSRFDEIAERHGIEKIKTIGDSYMAASGIPVPGMNDEVRIIRAAIDMTAFLEEVKQKRISEGSDFYFEARVGIHTGPVIAGIVGKNKFAYDIWGGTVNLASRIESNGEAGRINISGTTYAYVKEEFKCTRRGKIDVKSYKNVDMYFVETVK
ncbi:MAG: adenylate/guanylate cyclase domain-containing protein [Prolixibacteraceae bacterium]